MREGRKMNPLSEACGLVTLSIGTPILSGMTQDVRPT